MRRPTFSLTKKAILTFSALLLPVLITFVYVYHYDKNILKEHYIEDLSLVSDVIEGQVFQFIENHKRRAADFASDGFIAAQTKKIMLGGRGAAGHLGEFLTKVKLPIDADIGAIFIAAPNGRVISSTDPDLIGKDVSAEPYFLNAGTGPAYAEISYPKTGQAGLAFSAPLTDPRAKGLTAVLVNVVTMARLDEIMTAQTYSRFNAVSWRTGKLKTIEAYLVNKDKLMLTSSRFVNDAIMKQRVDTLPVNRCLSRERLATRDFYSDYRGVDVAGASICIPSLDWTLLVEVDSPEALGPVDEMRMNIVAASLAVAVIVAFFFIIFFKNIVKHLNALTEAAARIAGGSYDETIPVKTGDEIGRLANEFNTMAREIKTRSNALKESEEKYRKLISNIPVVSWTADEKGDLSFISPNVERITGCKAEEACAGNIIGQVNIHPEDADGIARAYNLLFSAEIPFDVEYRLKTKAGAWIWLHNISTSVYEKDGKRYADGVFMDVTERKLVEQALSETQEHLYDLAKFPEENPNPVMRISVEGIVLYANAAAEPLLDEFGIKRGGVLPERWRQETVLAYDSREARLAEISHARSVYSITFTPVAGSPYVNIYGLDITKRKKAEFELQKISTAMEQSVNLVFITDIKGNIEYVNPMFEKITGYDRDEAIGQTPRILSSGEISTEQYEQMWTTITSGKTWRSVYKNKKKNGTYYWCNSIISPIKNYAGAITHFLAVQEDVTEKMQSEERIKYLADFDELTCLANRAHFIRLTDEWISRASDEAYGALLIIDVDQFKYFNETYGHATGDSFLMSAAGIIRQTLEATFEVKAPEDERPFMLGRLSGDEFAVFLPITDANRAFDIAERLRSAVSGFAFMENVSPLGVSIGLVLYPEHGTKTVELFAKADAAMYRAKDMGRDRTHLYIQADHELEHIHSRFRWKERITKALREDRIMPWFQPILDLRDDNVHHYEALARMQDEDEKILLPGGFMETAERFGLVNSIDRTIIKKTMQLQARLMEQGKMLSFSMNLSGKDLDDEKLLAFIRETIKETAARPSSLVFEITETAAINDIGRAKEFVNSLKSTGCLFSLDDFGVGFTSFVYLKELAADFVKIDGSFIKKLSTDRADQAFVRAMVDVSRSLGVKTIAEFVETKETLDILKSYGVDYAQGYLVGKPRPLSNHSDAARRGQNA